MQSNVMRSCVQSNIRSIGSIPGRDSKAWGFTVISLSLESDMILGLEEDSIRSRITSLLKKGLSNSIVGI